MNSGSTVAGRGCADTADLLATALEPAGLRTAFQVIVDLTTGTPVAYEALTRGPRNSRLEPPDALLDAAREAGRLTELDWACRCTAFRAADAVGFGAPLQLFVNAEPQALTASCPPHLVQDFVQAHRTLDIVVEVTERYLLDAPAELLRVRDTLDELGWAVALDDVGANDAGVALLPVLRPAVVKLDRSLLSPHPSRAQRDALAGVRAYVERSGACLLAEGIETEQDLRRARELGATWGQGWLFGRPGPLAAALPRPRQRQRPLREDVISRDENRSLVDAFRLLSRHSPIEDDVMVQTVRDEVAAVCAEAAGAASGSLLVVQTGDPQSLPTGLYRTLDVLHDTCALVVVLDAHAPPRRSGVLRASVLDPRDVSAGDTAALLLGPDRATAVLARPGADGSWAVGRTHDPDVVADTARALLARVTPRERRPSD